MATDALPPAVAASVQAIRDDREHGASWLARAAAETMLRASETREVASPAAWEDILRATAQALVVSRPSMAAVANAAAHIWSAGAGMSHADRQRAIREAAARLATADEPIRRAIAAQAEKLVTGDVYTISRSGTVADLLRDLGQRGRIGRVLVAESRPGGEGVALARALAANGLRVTLVADAAAGVFVAEATCVLLGADSLRADGSVVNKVGSYPLALVAREAGRPVFVACETLKIAAPDFPLALEEKDPAELLPDPIDGLNARNPYFDVTPAPLIASYITEEGILDRAAIGRYAEATGDALARLRQ